MSESDASLAALVRALPGVTDVYRTSTRTPARGVPEHGAGREAPSRAARTDLVDGSVHIETRISTAASARSVDVARHVADALLDEVSPDSTVTVSLSLIHI